ncbi:MAG: M23 family metallopeptidase [Mycobacteriales bacterium]
MRRLIAALAAGALTAAATAGCGGGQLGSNPAAGSGAAATPEAPAAAADRTALEAAPRVAVAPLRHRITPDLLVSSATPLSATDIASAIRIAGATHTLLIAIGRVHLASGTTEAIGVDPSTFRAWAPVGTAESTPLWLAVADRGLAVAQSVARALAVPLGGTTTVGSHAVTALRVGAYATMGLPSVGVTADGALDGALGLRPGTGLLLAAPATDPVVAAIQIGQALGPKVSAIPLQVPVSQQGLLTWVAPAAGRITSPFGPRIDPLTGKTVDFHEGIDIGAPYGAPIYAASSGYVLYAGPAAGFGQEILLQHPGNVETLYGHMERILVSSGSVTVGEPIALVGSEGESTGPHLHFGVLVGGQFVDPLAWLIAHGVTVYH